MTKIWAHRGASGYAPENTMESYRLAEKQGADGVELDVQLTKDGEIVIIHDEKIDRTSNGKGWVKDYTLEELRKFNYNKTHPEYEHADIPTLREFLEYLKTTDMTCNIELKTGVVFYKNLEERTVDMVNELGLRDRIIYSSFNHYSVRRIKSYDPEAQVGLLYSDGYYDMPDYGKKMGADALHPALYNLQYPNYMEDCRRNGLAVNVWTVNDAKYMQLCLDAGVNAIITNYPDRAIALRDKAVKA